MSDPMPQSTPATAATPAPAVATPRPSDAAGEEQTLLMAKGLVLRSRDLSAASD